MSATLRKKMAVNSLLAWHQGQADMFDRREADILEALREMLQGTDREIMLHLGKTDPNYVRPRITELIEDGVLFKAGDMRDPVTGKTVRIVMIKADPRRAQATFDFGSPRAQIIVDAARSIRQ